jgi:hypothetical protein
MFCKDGGMCIFANTIKFKPTLNLYNFFFPKTNGVILEKN